MYGKQPTVVCEKPVKCDEVFSYLYLPIKLSGQTTPRYERRLSRFDELIGTICCNFVGEFGLDRYIDSNVYLTAHNMYQEATSFNRIGYHSDGFGTTDICYLWSNSCPTVFNSSQFNLSGDDTQSLKEMAEQANTDNEYTYPNNTVLRLDQFVIHRVGDIIPGVRCFFKMCFSYDKYDLIGNSHNYELDYDWEMRPRQNKRNVPQSKITY